MITPANIKNWRLSRNFSVSEASKIAGMKHSPYKTAEREGISDKRIRSAKFLIYRALEFQAMGGKGMDIPKEHFQKWTGMKMQTMSKKGAAAEAGISADQLRTFEKNGASEERVQRALFIVCRDLEGNPEEQERHETS